MYTLGPRRWYSYSLIYIIIWAPTNEVLSIHDFPLICRLKKIFFWNFLVAQRVKDLVLSLPWCRFHPWPWNVYMPCAWPKKFFFWCPNFGKTVPRIWWVLVHPPSHHKPSSHLCHQDRRSHHWWSSIQERGWAESLWSLGYTEWMHSINSPSGKKLFALALLELMYFLSVLPCSKGVEAQTWDLARSTCGFGKMYKWFHFISPVGLSVVGWCALLCGGGMHENVFPFVAFGGKKFLVIVVFFLACVFLCFLRPPPVPVRKKKTCLREYFPSNINPKSVYERRGFVGQINFGSSPYSSPYFLGAKMSISRLGVL